MLPANSAFLQSPPTVTFFSHRLLDLSTATREAVAPTLVIPHFSYLGLLCVPFYGHIWLYVKERETTLAVEFEIYCSRQLETICSQA